MARILSRCVFLGLVGVFGLARMASAQLLVVTDPNQVVRLPRPVVIIYPPHPHPIPHPRPVPPPPATTYKIQEVEIQGRIADQVAQVQVSQTFVNTGSTVLEVSFVFPLPYDGAIDQMTLMVDGREMPARLLKAEEARRLYEDIVRKNRDPALLEWMGTGLFKTSVFPVPPGEKRTVSMRYSQLCRKQEGLTDFLFPLSTAKYTSEAVEKVTIRMTVASDAEIKNVYSPTHAVEISRPDPQHATVTYRGTKEIPSSDFRLLYDVGKEQVATRVLSYRPSRAGADADGYFLLLASPKILPSDVRAKKTVVFAIDRSGSMSGKKIEQVRNALKFVMNNLREGDLFNIIAYDSAVEKFRPELERYNDATRKAALGFVEGLYAGGSTNIDAALRTALAQFQDSNRPNYVVFLTDGLPTVGVTNEAKIAEAAHAANQIRARLFVFGVGYDVNSRLLDKLARDNFGQSDYVRPNEDVEDRISRLYRRIESPVMTEVKIEFALDEHRPESGPVVNRVYPKGSFDLFAGEQLVVVGRYKTPGAAKVTVRGMVDGRQQQFDFPAKLADASGDPSNVFIEKLWAVRRVGEILDQLDLSGRNEELVKELVELSTRHGILTPYTSFLADENTNLRNLTDNTRRAERRLEALAESSGAAGVAQRAFKGAMQQAEKAPSSSASGAAMDRFATDAKAAPRPASRPYADGGMAKNSYGGRRASAAGGGMGGGMGGAVAGPGPAPSAPAHDDAMDVNLKNVKENVQHVGSRVFYRRQGQWIDSTLTPEQEAKALPVKQFSKDYFDLARRHGKNFSQYAVFDDPVLVNVEGQAYRVER